MNEHNSWKFNGVCAQEGVDTNVFFRPDGEFSADHIRVLEKVAKGYCKRCPVSGNCLDAALINNEVGVWGGTTQQERQRLRRRASRVFCTRCRSREIRRAEDGEICLCCGLSWLS